MPDANYVEYGNDLLRVAETGVDATDFFAENGYALGSIFGFFIAFFLILLIIILVWKLGKKALPFAN